MWTGNKENTLHKEKELSKNIFLVAIQAFRQSTKFRNKNFNQEIHLHSKLHHFSKRKNKCMYSNRMPSLVLPK